MGPLFVDVSSRTNGVHEDNLLLVVDAEKHAKPTYPQAVYARLTLQRTNIPQRRNLHQALDRRSKAAIGVRL